MARPKSCRLAAGTVAGLLAFSTGLAAQTLPLPALPADDPVAATDPTDPAAPPVAEVAAPGEPIHERGRAWEYGLGLGAGWDSNIEFREPSLSSWLISPRANLTRVVRSRNGELRIGGSGYWNGYPQQEDLSTYDATFHLDLGHRSSPRTTWRANGSYGFGYSDDSSVLTDQGVLLPLVKMQTLEGAVGVVRKLGGRSSFRLDGRIYRTEFEQDPDEPAQLADGQSIRSTAGLERTLGSRDGMALEYSLESTLGAPSEADAEGSYYFTHFGSLQWTHVLSPRSGLLLEAGGSYTAASEQASLATKANFYGGASYRRQVGRSTFSVFARREVAPAFGLGVSRLENRFGLDATIGMGRDWTLRLTGVHVKPETPPGEEVGYANPDEAYVSLGRRIGRVFEVSTNARYRRRSSTNALPVIEGFRAVLVVSVLSPTGASGAPRSDGR